jgi:hypothetical protein
MVIWIHDVILVAISLVNDNNGSAMYWSTSMLIVSYILSMGMPTSVMIKYCTTFFLCFDRSPTSLFSISIPIRKSISTIKLSNFILWGAFCYTTFCCNFLYCLLSDTLKAEEFRRRVGKKYFGNKKL